MQKLYIQLEEKTILIASLKEKNDKFYFKKVKSIKLNNFEIQEGKLYNLSTLYLKIKYFLKQNKIKKAEAIISFPYLLKSCEIVQDFITMQIALCISKTGLIIKKIIGKKKIEESFLDENKKIPKLHSFYKIGLQNQFDFFKKFKANEKLSPNKWFLFFFIILTFLISILIFIQNNKKKQLENLLNQKNVLVNQIKPLEKKIKILEKTKNNNKILNRKIKKIEKIQTHSYSPLRLLINIAQTIPHKCRLNQISINKKHANNKSNSIKIIGESLEEKAVINFLNNLNEKSNLKNLKLLKIQKEKNDNISKIYDFEITGKIKKQ